MVKRMRPGTLIVDLGADGGGNCELSRPGERVTTENGVLVMAPLNLPATMPAHASLLFGRNLATFVQTFTKDKAFRLDPADDIQKGSLVTHDGTVTNDRIREALQNAVGAAERRS
jgi:NAD(P) transhydrogenase subunit alpha